jgi:hypothetical protein
MNLPFKQEQLSENTFIRIFEQGTDSGDFSWHRDREDRIIESLEENNWLIQLDNDLPVKIHGQIFIPKGVYHRIIKGDGDLKIKLKKL